jgi:nucleoside 2-deoxyribosyltransferase
MTIYTASKTAHAYMWRGMRSAGYPIISTWIDEAGTGEVEDFTDLWRRCIAEARAADALLLFRAHKREVLKGAWAEAGAALAHHKPVFAIGCREFSIRNHPLWYDCEDVTHAVHRMNSLNPRILENRI